MEVNLLFLFLLCCRCQGWKCGDKEIEDGSDKICDCSGEEITEYERDEQDRDKKCCPLPGPVHCEVSTEGNVRCNNSHVCYSYKCGDTWLAHDRTCHCSSDLISYQDFQYKDKVCCPPPGPGHCEVTRQRDVKCYNSTVNKYNQPCNGECANGELCEGNITQGSGHQQCYKTYKMWQDDYNDKRYECVNRADKEQITVEEEGENPRNFSSVVTCTTIRGGPGLMCGEECYATNKWCLSRNRWEKGDCENFTTSDAKLCQNYTFWNNKDCNKYYKGRVENYGKRCTGQNMRCYYPHYMYFAYDYQENYACDDKSDQIHKLGPCTSEQHLEIYESHFCND